MSASSDSDSSSSSSSSPRFGASSSRTSLDSYSHYPARFVRLHERSLKVQTLSFIFERHGSTNIGLVVWDSTYPTSSLDEGWTEETCASRDHPVVQYSTSSTFLCDLHSSEAVVVSNPRYAQHLNVFSLAGLRSIISVTHKDDPGAIIHVLEKPAFVFPPLSHTISCSLKPSQDKLSGNIPTLDDWKTLWAAWDLVTLKMIPETMLHKKPIDLRHKCLFYIGHIPTFLDMLLSKSIGGSATEPKWFWNIFERGIDPHVDDPDHCHNHSEVPEKDEDWPTLPSIIVFRDGVRARLARLYEELANGQRALTRNIARTLVMTHEHEGFHIETLLYMLIQKAGFGTLPPPGFTPPPWHDLKQQWDSVPSPSTSTVVVGPAMLTTGHNDSEADDLPLQFDVQGHTFGWDNESPAQQVHVAQFRAEWRPITNGEFEGYLLGPGKDVVAVPVSWVEVDGEFKVRTLYGLVSMDTARHWPVLTSYDDLEHYAKAKGGRLPTEPELRLFLILYEVGHEGGGNVGFRNWHPVPSTMGLDEFEGKGSNGGVWEWTSTRFDTHDEFVPTELFTGYSADFFDSKHHVALGASYATIPRLADRRTIRNFYQHNYPYPWVGARVIYDA